MWADFHNIKYINKSTGMEVGSIVQDLPHSVK